MATKIEKEARNPLFDLDFPTPDVAFYFCYFKSAASALAKKILT
jgi:hypothetical protein